MPKAMTRWLRMKVHHSENDWFEQKSAIFCERKRLSLLISNQDFLWCVGKEMDEIKKTMTGAPCQNNTVWLGRKL